MHKTIKVGIVGGTGYTGVELLRLLAQHPYCELQAITSRKEAGMPVAEMFPNLRGRVGLWQQIFVLKILRSGKNIIKCSMLALS
jgi:N-acetyl-gamma-glutamylphosphate reductase